jgi:WXG100 family type VII secretion target
MAIDGFQTSADQMQLSGQHVIDVNQQLQGDLEGLRRRVGELAGVWRGQAATSFGTLMAQWDRNATSLNAALQDIGEAIKVSGVVYEQQDTEQSSGMSTIGAVMAQG